MKKTSLLLIMIIAGLMGNAQTSNVPYTLHFTAVARNPSTHIPVTSTVDVRLEVWHSSSAGTFTPDTFEYCEELHGIAPNSYGEFSSTFGTSAAVICVSGTTLDKTLWEHGNMWYIIKYDTAGGSFVPVDTGKFASASYSFAAHSAEKLVNAGTPPATGSTLTWNGTDWAAAAPGGGGGVPAGSVIAWAGQVPPAGWLFCDGSVVNSSSYPSLYSAVGTIWGNGTGAAGSFNLPDMRGMFLRGYDSTAGTDPDHSSRVSLTTGAASGNNVGSYQSDVFRSHTHSQKTNIVNTGSSGGYGYANTNGSSGVIEAGMSTLATGGSETRPKNVSVMYIIKY